MTLAEGSMVLGIAWASALAASVIRPAYHRDVPEAELHLLEDAGHWLLETHLDAALSLVRNFLTRYHG